MRKSWERGLWISQAGQRPILDLGIRSSQTTSEKTVSPASHYTNNDDDDNNNYINSHISIYVYFPSHLNNNLDLFNISLF